MLLTTRKGATEAAFTSAERNLDALMRSQALQMVGTALFHSTW